MSDVQLDLTKYWLMQWQFAALLSIGGWLAQHYSRIEYGFCFRYLCKHLGLIPGNNKIALYFFLYLIVLLCNFIWSYETQTAFYCYLVSKLFLDPDWLNFVWVHFFCWAPLHPYLYSFLVVDCVKTITQFLIVEAPIKVLLNGIIFLANGYIIMQCETQNLYLPFLWRLTVSCWEYWFPVERIVLTALISNSSILHFFGWLGFFFVRFFLFCGIAGPVLKQVESDDQKLLDAVHTYTRRLQQQRQHEWMHPTALNMQRRMVLGAFGSVSSGPAAQESFQTLGESSIPPLNSDSSEDESEIGYRVGKHLLRPRKPFVNKRHYMHDVFELPGYNEEEDSTYIGSQATEESDSESSEEEMSKAERDLYQF